MDLNALFIGIVASILALLIVEFFKKYVGFKIRAWYIPLALLLGFVSRPILLGLLKNKGRESVSFQHFEYNTIEMDGKDFNTCTFLNCKMIVRGEEEFSLINNTFDGENFFYYKDAASRTLGSIKYLWASGNTGFRYQALGVMHLLANRDRVFVITKKGDTITLEKLRAQIERLQPDQSL
ncbi:hypothetical protein ACOKFD_15570 [Flagellimonas sp. S174]|uniref:hypothetical protein n=1 Tax=Flagellimonas sp. S174 TaxID=3410790 RepID=UPI003BF581F2